eukprot:5294729-Pleurochrysis_carterae.AAC.1
MSNLNDATRPLKPHANSHICMSLQGTILFMSSEETHGLTTTLRQKFRQFRPFRQPAGRACIRVRGSPTSCHAAPPTMLRVASNVLEADCDPHAQIDGTRPRDTAGPCDQPSGVLSASKP